MSGETKAASGSRPDPAVMRGVIPYLGLDKSAGEAADFYARAFLGRELGRDPDSPGA